MPGALPIVLVAILTPAGAWHVGAPGPSHQPRAAAASGHRLAVTGQVAERSIVARGQHRRGAMPASVATTGSVARPEELRWAMTTAAGAIASAPPALARARAPPAVGA